MFDIGGMVLGLPGVSIGVPDNANVPDDEPCVSVVDWGGAWAELADDDTFTGAWAELEGGSFGVCEVATVTITVPTTRSAAQVSVTVEDALLRQTNQRTMIAGDDDIDGYEITVHVWKEKLSGLTPKKGMRLNDGTDTYEVKEVSHDNRRHRFKLTCLRER